jgi:hypothetical protein
MFALTNQTQTSRDVRKVPLADIQLVSEADLGDVGILPVSNAYGSDTEVPRV